MENLADISIADFEKLLLEFFDANQKIDGLKHQIDILSKSKFLLEQKVIAILKAGNIKKYTSGGVSISLKDRVSVKTPKTEEDKAAFFAWLKERGVEEQYLTVNSQSLNSLYKQEREAALERGDLDFKIPGIGEETIYTTLSIRS